ncbi:MAG: hypothetical protein Q9219_003296 [cf. Caloplaca sp. 3 TL-2023]
MASYFSGYLVLVFLISLTSTSAIPAAVPATPERQPLLDQNPSLNGSSVFPFRSAWSSPNPAPSTTIDDLEAEFSNLTFKPPECDGKAYGRNLQAGSCDQVLHMIPRDTRKIIFGKRNMGHWNINLPYRFLSGKSRRLSVKVFSYEPHVQCAVAQPRLAPPLGACDTVIDQIPANTQELVFGPLGFANVDVRTPLQYHDPDYGCELVVRSDVRKEIPDLSTWYDLWAAAVAVRTICVQSMRAGLAVDIGKWGSRFYSRGDASSRYGMLEDVLRLTGLI